MFVTLVLPFGSIYLTSQYIRDAFMNDGATPLFVSSQNGHAEVAKLLLSKGAKADQARNDGATPLITCSLKGNYEVAKLLLTNGAKVDKVNNEGATPLIMSSQ